MVQMGLATLCTSRKGTSPIPRMLGGQLAPSLVLLVASNNALVNLATPLASRIREVRPCHLALTSLSEQHRLPTYACLAQWSPMPPRSTGPLRTQALRPISYAVPCVPEADLPRKADGAYLTKQKLVGPNGRPIDPPFAETHWPAPQRQADLPPLPETL